MVYFVAATMYPQWTQDDPGWFGILFPAFDAMPLGRRLYELAFLHNSGTNEFRTYGLSKILHYGLAHLIGVNAYAFWVISALLNLATAAFVGVTVSRLLDSAVWGVAAFGLWLISPFSLWQTFHHTTYLLLPISFAAGYAALFSREGNVIQRWKLFVGAVLAILVVNTGEAAIGVLLMLQALLAVREYRNAQARHALAHLALGFVTFSTVLALYIHYSLAIYNPALPTRVAAIQWDNLPDIIWTYFLQIASRFLARSMLAFVDVRIIFLSVIGALTVAVLPYQQAPSAKLSYIGAAVLICLSAAPSYVALSSGGGFATTEYRHQQIVGLLLVLVLLLMISRAGRFRSAAMVGLIGASALSFATNFGVKVPANYFTNTDIGHRIAMVRSPASRAVLILRGNLDRPQSLSLTEPYAFDPASNPLQAAWSAESYARVEWDFKVIGSRYHREENGKAVIEGQFGSFQVDPSEVLVVFRGSGGVEMFPTLDAFEKARGPHGERLG